MRYGQDVFCNLLFLDEVIEKRKEEPYKTIYQILYRLSNIYLDIELNLLKEKIKDNVIYQNLQKRENKGLHSKLDWKNCVDFDNISDQVFFVDPNYIENYEQRRQNKGVLIISNTKKDLEYLDRLCRLNVFSLIPKSVRTGFEPEVQESWRDVFSKVNLRPINSLIISDNFLFNENFENIKEFSLFNLLLALVPKDLDVDFHLTIFFCNEKGLFDRNKAAKLIDEIKNLHLTNDDNKLKISIVSHSKKISTHDRHILSNYYLVNSGVGFGVIDVNGIQQIAKGESKCVFHSISDLVGDMTVKHEYNIIIEWLRKIYAQKEGVGNTFYIVGDTFVHRLLDENN